MKMSSGTHKDTTGHYYYEKKKKRDRLISHPDGTSILVPGTPTTLQGTYYTTGPFIAETIWVSNQGTETQMFEIYDGGTPLIGWCAIAPGVMVNITPVWMPFFESVNVDVSSNDVKFAVGGWIP